MRKIVAVLMVFALLFSITGCVSAKKYSELENDYNKLKKEYEDLSAQKTEVTPEEETSSAVTEAVTELPPAFDAEKVKKQVAVKIHEYSTERANYALVEFTNNSEYNVEIKTINVIFCDESENPLDSDYGSYDALAPGDSILLTMDTDTAYKKLKYDFTVGEADFRYSIAKEISFDVTKAGDKAIVSMKNNSEETVEYAEIIMVFYNNGQIVYHDSIGFYNSDWELEPGATETRTFTSMYSFDSYKVYIKALSTY